MKTGDRVRPPRFRLALLSLLCRRIYSDSVRGDGEELYEFILQRKGRLKADIWLWRQLVKSAPLFLFNSLQWGGVMLKNYMMISLRNMRKYKGYSIINLVGLSIGLACAILIVTWVRNELSYDQFHHNKQDIYRIIALGKTSVWDGMPGPLGPAVEAEIPEVLKTVRVLEAPTFVMKAANRAFYENHGLIADEALFEVFTFPLIRGDRKEAFASPMNIIISESMAHKYFGREDPLNRMINVEGRADFRVAAIMKNIPENSHMRFDYVVPFELAVRMGLRGMGWGDFNFCTFIQRVPGANTQNIVEKINRSAIEHKSPQIVQKMATLSLQPLTNMYLNPLTRDDTGFGNIKVVRLFMVIAVFILLIALINFVNLATARSENRALEISMRKVAGARRGQLVRQFMGDSLLFTMMATVLAVLLVQLLMPWFRLLTGKNLIFQFLEPGTFFALIGLAVITGLMAGGYPAFFLSSCSPVRTLGGRFNKTGGIFHGRTARAGFRKILVILQFTVSIGLIVGAWIVTEQLHFIKQKSWHLDQVTVLHVPVKENIGSQYQVFKNGLLAHPQIVSVGVKDCLPTGLNNNTSGVYWPGKTAAHNEVFMETTRVGYDYFKTVGMEMIAGREFSREFPADAVQAYILNETAVKMAGIEDPVGKPFRLYQNQGLIVGVVKDTYFKSLKRELNPQVYHVLTNISRDAYFGSVFIRVERIQNSRNLADIIGFVQDNWRKVNSLAPFEYHFLDDTIEAMYESDRRLGRIVSTFSLLAIFISCLGLIGLSTFMVEKRTRELGIRKTLGASVRQLVMMLTREFSGWILISLMIAVPVSYFIMSGWLRNFAYRTQIGIEVFLCSGALALMIAFISVSYQTIRAASANPVDAIRVE